MTYMPSTGSWLSAWGDYLGLTLTLVSVRGGGGVSQKEKLNTISTGHNIPETLTLNSDWGCLTDNGKTVGKKAIDFVQQSTIPEVLFSPQVNYRKSTAVFGFMDVGLFTVSVCSVYTTTDDLSFWQLTNFGSSLVAISFGKGNRGRRQQRTKGV